MAKHPYMPLFTDAYLSDTTHLTKTQHGWYLLVLIHMWRMPRHRFPNDDAWLANKFNSTVEEVRAVLRPIIKEFCSNDGNWITQKRLAQESSFVAARSLAQSERAKLRWRKEKKDAGAMQTLHRSGNALTPTKKEEDSTDLGTTTENLFDRILPTSTARVEKNARVGFEIPDWIPHEAWDGFVEMRKAIRHPLTPTARKLIVSKLGQLRDNGEDPAAVLNQSTMNSWRGLFAVKPEHQHSTLLSLDELHEIVAKQKARNGGGSR